MIRRGIKKWRQGVYFILYVFHLYNRCLYSSNLSSLFVTVRIVSVLRWVVLYIYRQIKEQIIEDKFWKASSYMRHPKIIFNRRTCRCIVVRSLFYSSEVFFTIHFMSKVATFTISKTGISQLNAKVTRMNCLEHFFFLLRQK